MRNKIDELNSQGTLRKLFTSSGQAEALKGYQETIRVALEELQVSAWLSLKSHSLKFAPISYSSVSILPVFSMSYVGFVAAEGNLELIPLL